MGLAKDGKLKWMKTFDEHELGNMSWSFCIQIRELVQMFGFSVGFILSEIEMNAS